MKKAKILGIGLSLMLLFSLLGFALPAGAAAPEEQQWGYGYEPGFMGYKIAKGSEIQGGFAINGQYVYMAESGYYSPDGRINRSMNEGFSWSHKTAYNDMIKAGTAAAPTDIAVAPDDKLAIAVTDGTEVYLSNDEGATWVKMATPTSTASTTITSVAVGPARSGLLIGREYAVTVQNDLSANTTGGDVLIYGNNGWVSAGSNTGINGTLDYLTVQFSPNFAGDRVLLAVGASATEVTYQTINTATSYVLDDVDIITGTALDVGSANATVAVDIAAPTDYDPTSTGGNVVFVSVASGDDDDDVFKVTPNAGTTLKDLGVNADVHSVAYGGTVDSGTLFVGLQGNTGSSGLNAISGTVKRSYDPHVTQPTWKTAIKNPTGASPFVRLSDSYAFNKKVIVATTGTEGAVSHSLDDGVSFSQVSMVDNGENSNIGSILDVALTSDESSVWLLTNDEDNQADMDGDLHLWEKPGTNASSTTWLRHWTLPAPSSGNNTGLLAINPDWETTPAIYIVNNTDTSAASNIYVSKNGGATWSTRTGPGSTHIQAIALSDADTVHVVVNDRYYQSTNGGWTWSDGVDADTNATGTEQAWIIVAPNGDIITGGDGSIGYSTDNGADFRSRSVGFPSLVYSIPAIDGDFANNKVIYAGGDNGKVYRYDGAWVDIGPETTSGAIVDITFGDGVMYAATTNSVLRNLDYDNPIVSKAISGWQDMDTEPASTSSSSALSGKDNIKNILLTDTNVVWAFGAQDDTWAYRDVLATEVPVLTAPADGYELAVDPTTGNGEAVTFAWETMGTGGSVPNEFQIEIQEVGGVSITTAAFSVDDISAPQVSSTDPAFNNYTFRANKQYQWRLRVTDTVSGDDVRSNWTDWQNLSVGSGTLVQQTQAGPILLGPQGGAITSLRPGFSWAPVPGATEYEFILATDAALTQTVANTPVTLTSPAYSLAADLDEDTTYFWAVKSTKPTVGEQAINTFTTRAPAAPPAVAPAPDVNVTVPDIVIPPIEIPEAPAPAPAAPVISEGILYTIIGIGAILIIAVLVLIVRTRRPL